MRENINREHEMPFIPLEKLNRLFDGYRKPIRVDGQEILLFQDSGQVYAIDNHCPHNGASLTKASVAQGMIRCPFHGIEFDLGTGRPRNGGCSDPLVFVNLVYDGDSVGIELGSE